MYCHIENLNNESDVEQKFVIPLLTENAPIGLGIESDSLLTKNVICPQLIDKGLKAKNHIPDYMICMQGIPLIVIEAKNPSIELAQAFYEAQLYAQVINSKFRHDVNPCNKIIATNGRRLVLGYYDSADIIVDMSFEDFAIGNDKFEKLISLVSNTVLEKEVKEYFSKIKSDSKFIKPVAQLGTKRVQDEEIPQNSFGITLAFDYQSVFTPDAEEDKMNIVKNAYVVSKKREHQADPLYKAVKRDVLPIDGNTKTISSDDPKELVEKVRHNLKVRKSLILLIGSKGSGKSTFIRHVYEHKLTNDLKSQTHWIYVDMNNTQFSKDLIYNWVVNEIYTALQKQYKDIDFEDMETIKKVFISDIKEFEKGLGSLLKDDKPTYNIELFKILQKKKDDVFYRLKKYTEFFCTRTGKSCVIVFDNCDKMDTNEQLLMFEVAQWLRNEYPFLIIMPLRDSTYDNYRNSPPLDTVIKDMVFRIDPPDFLSVLQYRLNYIMRLVNQKDELKKSYQFSDNIKVSMQNNEHIEYFKSILMSIRNDSFTKDMFYGLSGRNIRQGIEIFLDYCRSGHIQASNFLMMRVSDGEYTLPHHIAINALLRMNRKYYSDTKSPIKNIFSSDFSDVPPDPFVRLDILKWLSYIRENRYSYKDKFVMVKELYRDLSSVGHNTVVIQRELAYLVETNLVIYESKIDRIDLNGLICISTSGSQHLRLLGNINYLAACAEDVYYRNSDIAVAISERIKYRNHNDNNRTITYNNAKDMIDYLEQYRDDTFINTDNIIIESEVIEKLMNLNQCRKAIDSFGDKHSHVIKHLEDYPRGLKVEFRITSVQQYGLFGIFGDEQQGFIARKYIDDDTFDICEDGNCILSEIIDYSDKHHRFQLKLLEHL